MSQFDKDITRAIEEAAGADIVASCKRNGIDFWSQQMTRKEVAQTIAMLFMKYVPNAYP